MISIIIFSSYRIGQILIQNRQSKRLNEELIEMTEIEKNLKYYDGNLSEFINVNFDNLLSINSDTVGWIVFNQINFPIVQTNDNKFYLYHSFDRRRNLNGAIFLDYRNNNFYDKNIVIYGHNANSSRNKFGSLVNLLNSSYFDNGGNDVIQISTLTHNFNFQIFSVYNILAEDYYITTSFSSSDFNEFINVINRRSYRDFNIELKETDRILTLSTCYGTRGTQMRTVVHAKLVAVQERY